MTLSKQIIEKGRKNPMIPNELFPEIEQKCNFTGWKGHVLVYHGGERRALGKASRVGQLEEE